jgi:hypothetical protein
MAANFSFESTGKYIQNRGESKAGLRTLGAPIRAAPKLPSEGWSESA